jgi:hypothetical protein
VEHADIVRAALDDFPFALGQIGDLGDKDFGHNNHAPLNRTKTSK